MEGKMNEFWFRMVIEAVDMKDFERTKSLFGEGVRLLGNRRILFDTDCDQSCAEFG